MGCRFCEVTQLALREQNSGRWFRVVMGLFTQLGPLLIYFAGGYLIISHADYYTPNCDLTLAAGQEHIDTSTGNHNGMPVTAADASADAAARTWAGKTWKSITLK